MTSVSANGLEPPRPESGWSREFCVLPNAVLVPPQTFGLNQKFGVFDQAGVLQPQAGHWRLDRSMTGAPSYPEGELDSLAGRHLYCGPLFMHFGHFLTESLTRVWALKVTPGIQSLLYLPRGPSGQTTRIVLENLLCYQLEIFNLLGIHLPIQLISQPTRVEELVLAGQGFGLGTISGGTPEFHHMIDAAIAALPGPSDTGARIYVSRSRLKLHLAGMFFEDLLEDAFAAQGYRIYWPETETVAEQIATYRAASVIIGLDGSAFHLIGLVARAEQKIGIIQRRQDSLSAMVPQIEGFVGKSPEVFACVNSEWTPAVRLPPGWFHFGALDFAALHDQLATAGFITRTDDWPRPGEHEIDELVEAIRAGGNMQLVKVPSGMSAFHFRRRKAKEAPRRGTPS